MHPLRNFDLVGQEFKRIAHAETVRLHYDAFATQRADWIERNRWFYRRDLKNLQTIIPDGSRILEIGCGNGDLLQKLNPSFGVGVDISPQMVQVARERHPDLRFVEGNVEETDWLNGVDGPFDYILLSDVIGHPFDVQVALEHLQQIMSRETKLVITFFERWWEVAARLYIAMGFGMPRPRQNWLSRTDLYNVLALTRYEVVSFQKRELLPRRMFGIGSLLNRAIAPIPPINRLCWRIYLVARSLSTPPPGQCSVTVLVPCRNERGNIESCVRRLPEIGRGEVEILFVEGGSSDGTYEECLRVQASFPHRNIRVVRQTGKGKGDAVRLGFAEASGEIVIILDSDLAVPPEYMPRVYAALAEGQAEFVNCTRLVYPMEPGAMRTLNYIANHVFARFLSYLLNQSMSDTLCGTKALFKRDYLKIQADWQRLGSLDPFGDFDLIIGAARRNMRIVEIPVRYEARTYGETQIQRFSDGIRLFRTVWHAFRRLKTR